MSAPPPHWAVDIDGDGDAPDGMFTQANVARCAVPTSALLCRALSPWFVGLSDPRERQDGDVWHARRLGAVTTSTFAAVLNVYSRSASNALRARWIANPSRITDAWLWLVRGGAGDGNDDAGAAPGKGIGPACTVESLVEAARERLDGGHGIRGSAAVTADTDPVASGGRTSRVPPSLQGTSLPAWSSELRAVAADLAEMSRLAASTLSRSPLPTIQLAWGKFHENAAVVALAHALPSTARRPGPFAVAECPYLSLDSSHVAALLPGRRAWTLPPRMGASPDALVVYRDGDGRLVHEVCEIKCTCPFAGQSKNSGKSARHRGPSGPASPPMSSSTAKARARLKAKKKKQRHKQNRRNKKQEGRRQEEREKEEEEEEEEEEEDILQRHDGADVEGHGGEGCSGPADDPCDNGRGHARAEDGDAEQRDVAALGEAIRSLADLGLSTHPPKSARGAAFAVNRRGPPERAPPQYIPQLFMEMLCAKTQTALLCCKTAHMGMRVFRIAFDEGLARLMLEFAARFHAEHVATEQSPPTDLFIGEPRYSEMLAGMRRVADAAEVVVHVPPDRMVHIAGEGSDHRWFL